MTTRPDRAEQLSGFQLGAIREVKRLPQSVLDAHGITVTAEPRSIDEHIELCRAAYPRGYPSA